VVSPSRLVDRQKNCDSKLVGVDVVAGMEQMMKKVAMAADDKHE